MPENWAFVAAAYGLAALVFGGYWRSLGKKERELAAARWDREAVRIERDAVRNDRASRSQQPSMSGHPRPEPSTRPPLQQ
jgi:hypothetical protein